MKLEIPEKYESLYNRIAKVLEEEVECGQLLRQVIFKNIEEKYSIELDNLDKRFLHDECMNNYFNTYLDSFSLILSESDTKDEMIDDLYHNLKIFRCSDKLLWRNFLKGSDITEKSKIKLNNVMEYVIPTIRYRVETGDIKFHGIMLTEIITLNREREIGYRNVEHKIRDILEFKKIVNKFGYTLNEFCEINITVIAIAFYVICIYDKLCNLQEIKQNCRTDDRVFN